MPFRFALLALLLAVTNAAVASTPLPVVLPDGVYRDRDPAAQMIPTHAGQKAAYRAAVERAIRHGPPSSFALMERAYLNHKAGDAAHAEQDAAAALALVKPGSTEHAHVLWSRGWMRYDDGDYAGALADWQAVIASHGGRPGWVPHTFTLLYWSAGDVETSMAWYDATVAINPDWGRRGGLYDATSHWQPAQKDAIHAAFEEWQRRHAGTATSRAP